MAPGRNLEEVNEATASQQQLRTEQVLMADTVTALPDKVDALADKVDAHDPGGTRSRPARLIGPAAAIPPAIRIIMYVRN